jgi:hypothetical protein
MDLLLVVDGDLGGGPFRGVCFSGMLNTLGVVKNTGNTFRFR